AAALDAGVPADLLQGQPALLQGTLAAPARRLLRLALLLLLPARAGHLLRHAALLSALPSPPPVRRRLDAARVSVAAHDRAADRGARPLAGMAADPLGHALRDGSELHARPGDDRSAAAGPARGQGHAQGGRCRRPS